MSDSTSGDLTPPGPPTGPSGPSGPSGPTPPPPKGDTPGSGGVSLDDWLTMHQAVGRPAPAPASPNPYAAPRTPGPTPASDKGLGWTGFGLAVVFCVPLLPLAGAIVAVITLARRRFKPMWIAVVALVAGLAGTAVQVSFVTSDAFLDGFRDGLNESLEEDAEDARRSGEPTEIVPSKLRKGDCFDDPALRDMPVDETGVTETVTLLPCRDAHDFEAYAVLELTGKDYPGQDAIDARARGCFPAFRRYVGKPYGSSVYEVYFYGPTKQSWKWLGDKTVTCVLAHTEKRVRGSAEGSRR